MGVDCGITLPDNVRVKNVAEVIGIAAGLKPEWDGTSDGSAKWIRVPGVEVKQTTSPEMVEIRLTGKLIDGEVSHFVYYDFESDYGGRALNPRSTAFWIAVAHRLVTFFGGKIDYQDCDTVEVDYKRAAKSKQINSPSDGEPWDKFQKRLFEVKSITKEELEYYDKFAAYKMEEMRHA